jgi:hypothetical protein
MSDVVIGETYGSRIFSIQMLGVAIDFRGVVKPRSN